MPYKDLQKRKEHQKEYYQIHKLQLGEASREYGQTLKGKEVNSRASKKYQRTPKGKEMLKRHYQSHKKQYAEYNNKYCQTFKGKEANIKKGRKYRQSLKGKEAGRKAKARRKSFGFIPLNKPFEGCEGHHIDRERVVYIPKELHRSIWHSVSLDVNMDKINKFAFEYLKIENEAKIH